jgi:hypothetical protein
VLGRIPVKRLHHDSHSDRAPFNLFHANTSTGDGSALRKWVDL